MKENEKEPVDLPENAFRELEEGEEYNPIMSPGREYREVTPWSVSWGIVMAVLFSAAALIWVESRSWYSKLPYLSPL